MVDLYMRYLIDATAARRSGALVDYLGILPALDALLADDEDCIVLASPELTQAVAQKLRHIRILPIRIKEGAARFLALNTVVHRQITDFQPDAILFGLFIPQHVTIPSVVRFTNATLVDPAYKSCTRFLTLYERLALQVRARYLRRSVKHAQAVLCSSHSAAHLLLRWEPRLVPQRVIASYFGPPDFSGKLVQHQTLQNQRMLTMHLMPHKNIELILATLARPEMCTWSLSIMGDLTHPRNRYERYLAEQVRSLKLEGRLHSTGFLETREQVVQRMLEHDVLVIPSRMETWSHSVIEAMMLGMPVIASDIDTHREVSNGAAWLVDPESPQALSEILQRIEKSPEEREIHRRVGQELVSRLSWSKHAADILAVLRRAGTFN
jgi:glycosyltransferase involved in cell wall biosynthesis